MKGASHPPKIDLLPEHLIDQIKAGEVIERPGNLIKEVLENALDAGATRIELTIKKNGIDLISIKDDGHGMLFSDLPLAFSRHATSKISRFEDLYRLHSYGFRGEALASIAAISRLQCLSRTSGALTGAELRIEGGETILHSERTALNFAHGTELVIQDLFFNTPARLKFIQSQQSEKTFIRKIIFAFILARPEIDFQVRIDDGDKEIYPARESLLERLHDLFPKARDLILHSRRFYEENELDLYLIPDSVKGPLKVQNITINHRYILDKQLHRVLSNAIEATFGADSFHYIANFQLPPDAIDVNVHPNKTIIKVVEMSKLLSLLSSTVKDVGSRKSAAPSAVPPPDRSAQIHPAFFQELTGSETPGLQQERQQYNMEGFFSPHRLPGKDESDLIWLEQYFLKKRDHDWVAVEATRLLETFTKKRLQMTAPVIPLLVSEPFPVRGVKRETLLALQEAGLELEYLGSDTIVLRSIPDWMNGFPLKPVIGALLADRHFSEILIRPQDWSQATWEEMLDYFSPDELAQKKIMLDLTTLLRDKFR